MAELDSKRLQNLDEVLQQMNKTLATMETTLKDVGVAMTTAFGSATQQMVKNVQQAFRGAQLSDMLGIDQAKLGISDLQKEIKLLEGNLKSGSLGKVSWNAKSGNWKYSAGKTKMTDDQEYAAKERLRVVQEQLNNSMMSQEELMRKIVGLASKATEEAEKESLAKQSSLKKSIQLYQQYAQEYLRLTEQMKRETSKDGTLTKRGQALAAERSQYRQLMHEQAVEIRNARSEGVRLSQEEELKLEVAHRQKLRKIREQYDKQTDERKGTKGAQERALQEANTRKAMKEINRLLDDRNMKESNLAKEGKTDKYYDLQKRKIEEINQKIEEQKRLLGSYGISGERALRQLGGGEKQTDNLKRLIEEGKELEKEKKRLAKVQQEDAAWQEKQRANQAAIFVANGKAIEQQRQLADQIDRLTRSREKLVKSSSGSSTTYDSRNFPFVVQIENKIEELRALQAQIERQFQGSMKAGESAFASTKAERDNAEARKKIAQEEINASKQKAQKAKEAAAIQKKADAESMANQRRQIQIKSQLAAIDKNRITITKQSSDREKALAQQQKEEYKSLQSELSKLIARQKELNAVSQGSGRRAKDRLSTYTISESEKAMRRYADAVRNAHREQKKLGDETNKILPTLQRLASAFGVAFSVRGLAQFGKKLIETRGEFEMQFVAMKQIIGDEAAATKIWNQTMQQALQSPFKAMQLVTYTKQLAAYRIETEKLFDTTKRLADISAGLGVDMGRLILAYGQVKSANFLRASEIRQFTEAGVNIVGNLAQYFTELEGRAVSTAEVMERVTKRMVSFADVEEIFKRMTDEGGEFYKMQEVQADTVKGQINKLHDAYDQMLNTIGQANQGTIRKFVEILNNMVRNWRDIVPLIKSSVAILGTYVAVTKLARMGTQKYGDAIVRLRLGKKKQTVEMEASLVKETLLLNRQAKTITAWQYQTQKAIFNVKMAWKALGGIFKSFAPFLAIEGALYAFNKIMEPIREARRLSEDLANIRVENKSRADEEVNNYDKLIRRFNELNRGSIERKEIIDKLNSQYGKYIGFQVSETTTLNDLAEAQERVNLNIREKARLRAEEEAQQRIAEDYIKKEKELLEPKQAWGIRSAYSFFYNDASTFSGKNTMWLANAEKFAEYAQTKIHDLTDEELKSRQELVNATGEWLNTFYGVSGATDISKGLVDLVELYAEQEQKLRDERKQISEDLKGLPLQAQEDIMSMQSQVATAMQKLTKAEAGEKVEIPLLDNMKIVVPPDLAEKSGVWEVIKQEINKRQEDFKIELKLNAGAITKDQAEELRKQAKTTGDIFVDAVNKEISEGILKSAGIEGTFDDLKKKIIDYPEMISDWANVNHAIELINNNLITASDIANGLTNYTKILSENLVNGRAAIDESVKKQDLLVNGTEEEVKKAQEAVDKAKERYKWLLRIAKLLGLDTKAADEIVEEQGYDLSVGQFRLAAAQSAFMEKFGKASNAYGKQLSQIGVTENLKEVADAYHKQSDELDGLIKNQEKALENETNLTDEQKENAKTTIENLKEQKSMAEFLAEFFGYVPKKTTTRTTHENASKLISLIKEMRGEYDKLSKSAYGYAKSEEKVRESYKDSVKKILGKAGITDYDFTTNEGMIKALGKVKSYATNLGKDAAAEVQKYIDQLETEIEINAQVKIREDFVKEIEKDFNNYQLTIDLQGLNIDKSLAKDWLGVAYQSLGGMLEEANKFANGLIENKNFSEEDLKTYKQWVDKIENEILKTRKEKAKEYSKYLEKELSERAKTEMEYAVKVAEVQGSQIFTKDQKDAILGNMEKDYTKAMQELTWKSFKESTFYVEMMDDLSSIPADYSNMMLAKINELLMSPQVLSPRAFKEAIKARQRILEALREFKPLEARRKNKSIVDAVFSDESLGLDKRSLMGGKRRELDKAILARTQDIDKLEQNAKLYEHLTAQVEAYEKAENNASLALKNVNMSLGTNEDEIKKQIDSKQQLLNQSKKEEDRYKELLALRGAGGLDDAQKEELKKLAQSSVERQKEIEGLEVEIKLLNDAKQAVISYSSAMGVLDKPENEDALKIITGGSVEMKGGTVVSRASLASQKKENEEQIKNQSIALQKLKDAKRGTTEWARAFHEFYNQIGEMNNKVKGMGDAFYDTYEALGGETNALTEGWKEFGDTMVDVINKALQMIPTLVTGFTSAGVAINSAMGIIGLIAEAVQLVLVAMKAVAKLHDASYERQIEIQQDKIENLQRAYERLEKSLEKTWDTTSYIRVYREETQNLYEQYDALTKQMDAERSKKNADKDKLQDYEDKQQEILDNLEEMKQKQIEVFGGIGEDNYRSAAEEFVSAWKDAFLETGDGLQGLQDHFDEFLNDWFVKQATMRVARAKLDPLFRQIDAAVDRFGVGGSEVWLSELENIRKKFEVVAPQLSKALEDLAGEWSLGGEGSLSGLAAGIQGMTEEQANILEAYWNGVRSDTSSIAYNVANIAAILGAGGRSTNPQIQYLESIASNTGAIREMLSSALTNDGNGKGFRSYAL